jgi:hypothetical protein
MKKRPPSIGAGNGYVRKPINEKLWGIEEDVTADFVDAVIRVTRYRFAKFMEAFGRYPGPTEPFFFVKGLPYPALPGAEELLGQLTEAAETTGVDLQRLKNWFDLS